MPGQKRFVNNSGSNLMVTLFVRRGDSPGQEAGTVIFKLNSGAQVSQTYGSDTGSIFLDGVAVEVVDRGSALDNVLNTNNTITFSSAGGLTITGSNG